MSWESVMNAIAWSGSVELDEGFFTVGFKKRKEQIIERGRGSQWKAKILVMIESSDSTKTPKRGRTNKAVGHLKMQIISGLGSKTITKVVKEQLEPLVELTTDDSISYIKFDKLC